MLKASIKVPKKFARIDNSQEPESQQVFAGFQAPRLQVHQQGTLRAEKKSAKFRPEPHSLGPTYCPEKARTHLGGERLDGVPCAGRTRAADGASSVNDIVVLRRLMQWRAAAGGELLLGAGDAREHPTRPPRSGHGRAVTVCGAESRTRAEQGGRAGGRAAVRFYKRRGRVSRWPRLARTRTQPPRRL